MAETTVDVEDDAVIDLPEDFDPENLNPETEAAAAKGGTVAAPSPPPDPAPAEAADQALQRSLEEERNRRIAAEQRAAAEGRRADGASQLAQQREQEAQEARESFAAAEMRQTVAGIEAAKRDMSAAKAALRTAHDAGDTDKLADAQEQIALAAAEIRRLEVDRIALESKAARAERAPPLERTPPPPSDPVEAFLANPVFSPRAKDWLRAHRDCLPPGLGGDGQKNAAMIQAHHLALSQGIPMESDDYFRVVEEKTGYRTPTSAAAVTTPAGSQEGRAAPQRRAPIPSAAPTNEPPPANGTPVPGRSRSFRLTEAMQEMALTSYPQKDGEDERAWRKRAFGTYGFHLGELTKEGKIGRTTH